MTVRNTPGAQQARLKRTLWAAAGGAAMSLVLSLLFIRGTTWLNASGLWVLMAIFWAVNLSFVLAIRSNLNLRLKDPGMTLAQMMWATVSTFVLLYFVSEGRHLLLMIYLLAMTFGAFRLDTAQHLLVALTAAAGYGIAIASTARLHPGAVDLTMEFLSWVVFVLVLMGFSVLGGETSRLHAALVRRNRELREARDASEIAFQAKARFLASTSHELRTPLNAMLGATDVVDSAALQPEQHDALKRARYAGKHLLSLINTMIDLSRIESGALELRAQPMNLRDELDSLQAMMLPEAASRGIELTLDAHGLSGTQVIGDAMRIQEVLIHLLKLTIGAASVREVCLRAEKLTDSELVRFSVSASGATSDLDLPDTGAHSDDNPPTGSFSLDLCKRLIALMDGTLITSGPTGQNARYEFNLDMPRAQVLPSDSPTARGRRKILIVDDSIDNRMLLQAFLENQPWELHFAENGLVAITQVEQQSFDLILMDIQMPRMNGIDATRFIREMEHERPDRAPAKILAITADDSVDGHQRSLDAGCDGHLVKPVSKKSLLQILASTIASQ
jgi:signal transduction histidine kinase/ActR/RegA family two-component response regulator